MRKAIMQVLQNSQSYERNKLTNPSPFHHDSIEVTSHHLFQYAKLRQQKS